jgi:hypothetical protein
MASQLFLLFWTDQSRIYKGAVKSGYSLVMKKMREQEISCVLSRNYGYQRKDSN